MKYKKAKKLIRKYVDKWARPLGLLWWRIDLFFIVDPKTIKKHFTQSGGRKTVALVFAQWEYSRASIYFNMREIEEMNNEEIEDAIIHELCHILVNEMREGGIKHEERVVTGLQRAFMWTRDSGR